MMSSRDGPNGGMLAVLQAEEVYTALVLSGAPIATLTPELAAGASVSITIGVRRPCPVVPGVKRDDWPLEAPKGKRIEAVRAIRDEIPSCVQELVEWEGWASR